MRTKTIISSFVLVLFLASHITAQYSAGESFEYPAGAKAYITNQGTATNGWGGPWLLNDGKDSLVIISNAAFHYSDLDYPVPYTGNHITAINPGNWATSARYTRLLDKTWPDAKGTYWVSFLFEMAKAPSGNTYIILKLYNGSSEIVAIGKGGGGTVYSCGSGWPGGSGSDVSTTQCEGGPVWLVTRIDMSGDANSERTFMWINPDPSSEPDTATADVKRNTTANSGFNTVAFEFGGEDADMELSFDEMRLGKSYADVSSPLVSSGYLARESFEYTVGTSIDTLMGSASNGWEGSWYNIVAHQANAMVASDTGLAYSDLNYPVPNVGNHLESVPDPSGDEQRYGRRLDKTWPNEAGRNYWISFLMNVKNATDNSTWLGVKFYNGDNGEMAMLGKGHGLDKYTCGSGWHGSAGPEVSTTAWDAGPVWLVGKMVMKGAASSDNDSLYMWINPDPNGGEPSVSLIDAAASSAWKNGFNIIRIEFGGTVGDGLGVSFDELRLGTSYADVSSTFTDVPWNERIIPTEFSLYQNYPNPFNPSTKISYTLKNNGKVRLAVFDMLGREVAVLLNEIQGAGIHEVPFKAENLSSGIYFYRLQSTNGVITKKMLLLK